MGALKTFWFTKVNTKNTLISDNITCKINDEVLVVEDDVIVVYKNIDENVFIKLKNIDVPCCNEIHHISTLKALKERNIIKLGRKLEILPGKDLDTSNTFTYKKNLYALAYNTEFNRNIYKIS